MADYAAAFWMAVQDPLVIALCLLILGVVAARFLFRGYPRGRAITRLVFFILLTIALLHAQILPYRPMRPTGQPLHNAVGVALEIAWWLWAAWLVVGILRSVLVFERRPREGKLLQDILAGVVYLAAIFAIIAYVFDLPVQGLLATSGAIAIIIGLALQSSLGDVFSGLVLSFSRPYRPDDWIRLDGGTEGKVIELNWRATHILTSQSDLAIVPNSMIAKSKIVNLSSPTRTHGINVRIQLDAGTAPSAGIALLRRALLNVRQIRAYPEPSVMVKSMNAAAVDYELEFFVDNLNEAVAAQNDLFDLIHRHLVSAEVSLASPDGQSSGPPDEARKRRSGAERLLEQVPIFASLTAEERTSLGGKLKRKRYERGETLLKPGTVLQSLYLVGTGVLSVARHDGGRDFEVLRLGPGDHFGEVGLLTGNATPATITALSPAVVYELPKADLAPILEARPLVAQELSHVLAERLAAGQTISAADPDHMPSSQNLSDWFSERFHRLFEFSK